jgi:hypothetical protein
MGDEVSSISIMIFNWKSIRNVRLGVEYIFGKGGRQEGGCMKRRELQERWDGLSDEIMAGARGKFLEIKKSPRWGDFRLE